MSDQPGGAGIAPTHREDLTELDLDEPFFDEAEMTKSVDTRPRELAAFAGNGGGLLASKLLGWRTVVAIEINKHRQKALMQRIRDGCLEDFHLWPDVRTFDSRPWRGLIDVVTGGFPCQGISAAGRGHGLADERSSLWAAMADIIREVQPEAAFIENSPQLTSRGLEIVLCDLASLGFDAEWGVLGASDAIWLGGIPAMDHLRRRIWIWATRANSERARRLFSQESGQEQETNGWTPDFRLALADANSAWERQSSEAGDAERHWPQNGSERASGRTRSDANSDGRTRERRSHSGGQRKRELALQAEASKAHSNADGRDGFGRNGSLQMGRKRRSKETKPAIYAHRSQWAAEPRVGRVAHGVADRLERISALGEGQVPAVAYLAARILAARAYGE